MRSRARSTARPGASSRRAPTLRHRRTLEGSIPVALLPPGDYVARAVITTDGRKVGQVTRPFRVGRIVTTAKAKPAAAGARASMTTQIVRHSASRTDRFDRGSVLTPQVVGFFVERLNVGARGEANPEPVVEHARAGRFDEAVKALTTGASSVPVSFFSGLALLLEGRALTRRGNFVRRCASIRSSSPRPSTSDPATRPAGAIRTPSERGSWRSSLKPTPRSSTRHRRCAAQAARSGSRVEILNKAASEWPDNDEVQVRIGAALAMAGKRADALTKIEPYLEGASRHRSATFSRCACSTKPARTASLSDRPTKTGHCSPSGPPPMPPQRDRNGHGRAVAEGLWLNSWRCFEIRQRHPLSIPLPIQPQLHLPGLNDSNSRYPGSR